MLTNEEASIFNKRYYNNLKKEVFPVDFIVLKVELKKFDSLLFIEQRSTNVNLEYDFIKKRSDKF